MNCCHLTIIIPVEWFLSSYNLASSCHLEKVLDWDKEGVDSDLSEIARQFVDWEENATLLELTSVNIADINKTYPSNPVLQR